MRIPVTGNPTLDAAAVRAALGAAEAAHGATGAAQWLRDAMLSAWRSIRLRVEWYRRHVVRAMRRVMSRQGRRGPARGGHTPHPRF
jgi:hypothetical protein